MIYLFCKVGAGLPAHVFLYQHHWPELRQGFYLHDLQGAGQNVGADVDPHASAAVPCPCGECVGFRAAYFFLTLEGAA